MRVVVLLVIVAIALMFLGGWLYYRDSGSTSEIILDREKVQQDTEKAVESSEQVLEKTAEGLKTIGEKTKDAFSDDEAPAESSSRRPTE